MKVRTGVKSPRDPLCEGVGVGLQAAGAQGSRVYIFCGFNDLRRLWTAWLNGFRRFDGRGVGFVLGLLLEVNDECDTCDGAAER